MKTNRDEFREVCAIELMKEMLRLSSEGKSITIHQEQIETAVSLADDLWVELQKNGDSDG